MKADIHVTEQKDETVLHPSSRKGAAWIARFVTTNVVYCDKQYALELLGMMREDGLRIAHADRG
jgi:hypothetical protein